MGQVRRQENTIQRYAWLAAVAAAVVVMVLFIGRALQITGGELGVPLDDAWIHFQFARNLRMGQGFSFNPGEPTPGSTAPLWTLLLAAVAFFTTDLLLPSLVLSGFFLLVTVWAVYRLVLALAGDWRVALAASTAAALTGRFVWAGLAGMETTAFTAVSVLGIWAYTRQGLRPLPALLFGLASQLRPEGHALFALAVADTLYTAARENQWQAKAVLRQIRPFIWPVLLYIGLSLPYTLFSLATTGHPLANTFYAKVGTDHFFSWRTLREIARLHFLDNPVAFVLLPLGVWAVWPRSRLTALWVLLLPLFTAVIVDFLWHHGRYTMPLIPLQMAVAALGVARIKSRLPNALWLALCGLLAFGGVWRLPHWAEMLGNNTREIIEIDQAMGLWLAENTPPDALVAVDDIGAVAYLSQRRIFDLNGLVTPEMWPAMHEGAGSPLAVRLMAKAGVTHLAVFPPWHQPLVDVPGLLTRQQQWQVDTYTIIGWPETAVFTPQWPYLPQAAPEKELAALFGQAIRLAGIDLPHVEENTLRFALYWQSETAVSESYTVFVHLLDETGQIVSQWDKPPFYGLAPTNYWQPGDIVRDPITLQLPADLPPDQYRLSVGLYLPESGQRLPTGSQGDAVVVDEVVISP